MRLTHASWKPLERTRKLWEQLRALEQQVQSCVVDTLTISFAAEARRLEEKLSKHEAEREKLAEKYRTLKQRDSRTACASATWRTTRSRTSSGARLRTRS